MRSKGTGGRQPPVARRPLAGGASGARLDKWDAPKVAPLVAGDKCIPLHSLIEAQAQHPRDPEADLAEVRASWWRLHQAGVELPAEPGVIVIRGGRR